MVPKGSDSSSKSRKSHGEHSGGGVGNLTHKLIQLKRQIQAERTASTKLRYFPPNVKDGTPTVHPPPEVFEEGTAEWKISLVGQVLGATPNFSSLQKIIESLWKKPLQGAKIQEKVEKNRKKLKSHLSYILSATSSRNTLCVEESGFGKTFSSRIQIPLCKFAGFAQGSGVRDSANGHEVVSSMSVKLPYVEKLPPYTSWIFLDKNQSMVDDQSVVGRRLIYYDQHGSEALICSESEEEIAEPEEDIAEHEEEKHEFSDGEDRILWTVCQEYGLGEEILTSVSQFFGVTISEIQDRHGLLRDNYSDQNIKVSESSVSENAISSEKSLSTALDSFDNIFCRRCLSEKQPYWSDYEDDRKPCSDQCYLRMEEQNFIPCIRNTRKAPMAAILNVGRTHPWFFAIYQRLAINPISG